MGDGNWSMVTLSVSKNAILLELDAMAIFLMASKLFLWKNKI
jgi:hypothetical protein